MVAKSKKWERRGSWAAGAEAIGERRGAARRLDSARLRAQQVPAKHQTPCCSWGHLGDQGGAALCPSRVHRA